MLAALIADLEAAGARLSIRDGALAVAGPRTIFTPEVRARIEAHQAALLAALAEKAEPTETPDAPAVQLVGTGVLVTGLDNRARHRVMWAVAGDPWEPVRNAAARHDYKGGAIAFAPENESVAARVAKLARRALELPEPIQPTNGEEPCGLK